MKNERTGLEYGTRRSSLIDRIIAWKEGMQVLDFIIPTDNPHIAPSAQYNVFYKGNLGDTGDVLTRVQSACVLGRVYGFDDCDCQSQLLESHRLIREEPKGLLIYCKNDHGKGVGLRKHAKTLAVEKFKGLDEDSARSSLGLKDSRDYKPLVVIVDHFGIRSIRLLTNNASKLNIFRQYAIPVKQVRL
ncbi:MAG: hypothetical protein NTW17_00180 [Candidatus Pacearchaeota archaeon]|nr:hypothetical protein [Candidatus Pacearchaeota archaeon]